MFKGLAVRVIVMLSTYLRLICWFIIFDTRSKWLCWSSNGFMWFRYHVQSDWLLHIYADVEYNFYFISMHKDLPKTFMSIEFWVLITVQTLFFSRHFFVVSRKIPKPCELIEMHRGQTSFVVAESLNVHSWRNHPIVRSISLTLSIFLFFTFTGFASPLSRWSFRKRTQHISYIIDKKEPCSEISTKQIIKIMKTGRIGDKDRKKNKTEKTTKYTTQRLRLQRTNQVSELNTSFNHKFSAFVEYVFVTNRLYINLIQIVFRF